MSAYYNEIDPYAAAWLRNLISEGHIAPGFVDERSIVDVRPDDVRPFTQCHFFAGLGGWSYAARLAGWPDDRPLWTGSCPCQPFSVAGTGKGTADARHLWPEFHRLIAAVRPRVVMGEQVAAAVGKSWLDGMLTDLEGDDYTGRAIVVPACAVDAPHIRQRLWFVADVPGDGRRQRIADASGMRSGDTAQETLGRFAEHGEIVSLANCTKLHGDEREHHDCRCYQSRALAQSGNHSGAVVGNGNGGRWQQTRHVVTGCNCQENCERQSNRFGHRSAASFWEDSEWLRGADGKARRVKSGIRLLAHGVPARVAKLRALGNAIVPQVAAEVIGAYMDTAD